MTHIIAIYKHFTSITTNPVVTCKQLVETVVSHSLENIPFQLHAQEYWLCMYTWAQHLAHRYIKWSQHHVTDQLHISLACYTVASSPPNRHKITFKYYCSFLS